MTWRNMLSTKKIEEDGSKAENNTFLGDPPYKRFPSHVNTIEIYRGKI